MKQKISQEGDGLIEYDIRIIEVQAGVYIL